MSDRERAPSRRSSSRANAPRRPACRGFTLIEAIVAILVISIAVPSTLIALRDATVARVTPVLFSRARWLATERMEDVIADRHSSTRGWSYIAGGNYASEASIPGFPGFARSVSITQTGPDLVTAGAGYKVVRVTVTWADPRRGPQTLWISSVLTDLSS